MQTASLFIVEDDAALAQQMADRLAAWAYRCQCVHDFGNVLGEFAQSGAQLVILDVSLPLFDGYYWCAQIRKARILSFASAVLKRRRAPAYASMRRCLFAQRCGYRFAEKTQKCFRMKSGCAF